MGTFLWIAIVWLIIEILVWIAIAQFISGWWVFLWFIVAAVIGLTLLRKGMTPLRPMAAQMKGGMMPPPSGGLPESAMTKAMVLAGTGLLLAIPGVLSDLLAVTLLLPPVQTKLKDAAKAYAVKNQAKMMAMMQAQMQNMNVNPDQFGGFSQGMGGTSNPSGNNMFGGFGNRSTVVDGEAKVVKPATQNPKLTKKIKNATNDEN